jgi:hypothetical protein
MRPKAGLGGSRHPVGCANRSGVRLHWRRWPHSREFKELEIVVLRHELAVLAARSRAGGWTRVTVSFWLRPAGCSA